MKRAPFCKRSYVLPWYEDETDPRNDTKFRVDYVACRMKAAPLISRFWRYIEDRRNWDIDETFVDVNDNLIQVYHTTWQGEIQRYTEYYVKNNKQCEHVAYGCEVPVSVYDPDDNRTRYWYEYDFAYYNETLGPLIVAIYDAEMNLLWKGMLLKLLEKYCSED